MNSFELPGDCPSGLECPVHFRLDREIKEESWMMYQAVTYVGNFCVLTGENPKYIDNPLLLLSMILDGRAPNDLFQTSLYEVGYQGTLYDLTVTEEALTPRQITNCGDFLSAELNHNSMISLAKSFA